ncbi:lipoprotein [Simiduia curdlanivorans]|uniref:Lipoprotein n=1 Tax=Simiduia curdlanivorans TaxID=1492769 RepID=A0ABV8V1L5_9GAMM|nr:lipoprotein [Simiduia curdlanivorans]MDN3638127.1 lipoprotein [Simiduia curdlanivorans]
MSKAIFLLFALALLTLSACGQKGPLVVPQPEQSDNTQTQPTP